MSENVKHIFLFDMKRSSSNAFFFLILGLDVDFKGRLEKGDLERFIVRDIYFNIDRLINFEMAS